MDKFVVGDVCEVIDHPRHLACHRKWIGRECTVVALTPEDSYWDCVVDFADKAGVNACFMALRKKRPPPQREQTTTWDDVIVWRPREIAHV